jgi:hypothetical protein
LAAWVVTRKVRDVVSLPQVTAQEPHATHWPTQSTAADCVVVLAQ